MQDNSKINADFDQRVVVHGDAVDWLHSPAAGVDRRPLDRIGGEVARATTIVRFAPGSRFAAHVHGGGEEFLVLDGVFEDEHGAFPAGSYIRNPPTSRHAPASGPGCTILVKLWQMQPEDRTHVRLDTAKAGAVAPEGRPGVRVTPLYDDGHEWVRMEQWAPGTEGRIAADGGGELFVVEGSARESGTALRPWSWVRIPVGGGFVIAAGPDGARFWIKTGHLRDVRAPE
ncbi:MAG: cupin domain-containing protein [Alphaproteobacteria bacterium]|nr:cupin domain-containing protein [Alphaproteobacteria bacterium]